MSNKYLHTGLGGTSEKFDFFSVQDNNRPICRMVDSPVILFPMIIEFFCNSDYITSFVSKKSE